ncbi:Molybdopterin converting factor, large subunit [Archaeoglobus sulfaticallidus PM70-1]|uniref:Molybdopterin converting factor, large subunit n=1 Tax=Archaeoglobus sulfaticallidus PM70-1 TaxID=387631 RepID=N0BFJ7_9EURY|nr:molybdenum cofactor biosynthesis protein MoaE [Archaeoglobus sulfaticallidus]AGK61017.1 Molybdopterin converting factor, large subunit [Archaeoglobus sulfaticallidus PM70-1]
MKILRGFDESKENAVLITKKDEKIFCKSEKLQMETTHDLGDVLEVLASLGYEFAFLDGFNEVDLDPEVESLASLIKKVKRENAEYCGAIGIFVGFVRKFSDGKEVVRLEYEAYEPVFSEKVREIENILKSYPGVEGVKIFHKKGKINVGEDIVYVVIMGRHRKDVWKPLSESMEIIKRELPVWKKEIYVDGEQWVHDKLEQ